MITKPIEPAYEINLGIDWFRIYFETSFIINKKELIWRVILFNKKELIWRVILLKILIDLEFG
jgi:hypothetical protein